MIHPPSPGHDVDGPVKYSGPVGFGGPGGPNSPSSFGGFGSPSGHGGSGGFGLGGGSSTYASGKFKQEKKIVILAYVLFYISLKFKFIFYYDYYIIEIQVNLFSFKNRNFLQKLINFFLNAV